VSVLEITRVAVQDAPAAHLKRLSLDEPRPGTRSDTYSFDIKGWMLSGPAPVEAVEVVQEGRLVLELPVSEDRPDVAAAFPEISAEAKGFRGAIGSLSLRSTFDLLLRIRLSGGRRLPLGRIEGNRTALPAGHESAIQPLMVNTIGRSGSSWLLWLLSCHPEIVAFKPFGHDVRAATYWTTVLQALSQPQSYLRQFDPETLEDPYWWIAGRGQDRALGDPRLAAWLGRDNVEGLVEMCRSRIQAFYSWVTPSLPTRFFVEKSFPYQVQADLLSEIYPGARELILVRDFRDMLSSVLAFNAKRGYLAFGMERAGGEADYVTSVLEPSARSLLGRWRRRFKTAHLVRYEDLALEPAETLARLLRYLGVDSRQPVVEETLKRALRGQPGMREHRTVTDAASSVGRWRHDLPAELAEICNEALGPLLAEFGYAAGSEGHGFDGDDVARQSGARGDGDDWPTHRRARGTRTEA
jgi:hypothetical protein